MKNSLSIKRRKPDRYVKLFTPIYHQLYRYILSIVRNKYMAEDVMQETLLIGYIHFYQLQELKKFKSWIFTIAKRESFRALKAYQREVTTQLDQWEKIIDEKHLYQDTSNKIPEIFDFLPEIIQELKSDEQDIILMRYYGNFSLEEVASILHIKYNTVKSKHRRAKNKILQELQRRNLSEKT